MGKPISKRRGCLVAKVPHPGYYESIYSHEFDDIEEQEAESRAQSDRETQRPEVRIDADTYRDLLMSATDWRAAENALNVVYVACLNQLVSELIGTRARMTYESMDSPREYNFTTDRVYADVPIGAVKRMLALCERDRYAHLRQTIEARCTSRSGFVSHYSNDLDTWLAKSVTEWDHNELGILLEAVIAIKYPDNSDFTWHMYNHITEDGAAYEAWASAVDWEKFDRECVERRDGMIAELRQKAADAGETFEFPEPRCAETKDLFTER